MKRFTDYPDAVIVPHGLLSPETFNRFVEEFVTRSGTDYGRREASLEEKCAAVRTQFTCGKAVIVFDKTSETCTVVLRDSILKANTADSEDKQP